MPYGHRAIDQEIEYGGIKLAGHREPGEKLEIPALERTLMGWFPVAQFRRHRFTVGILDATAVNRSGVCVSNMPDMGPVHTG